jgi:hypothetical protein
MHPRVSLRFLTTTKYACYKRANPAFSQERTLNSAVSLKNKMFALHHHSRMIVPNMPLSDASSDILLRSLPQHQKFSPGHVYLRQQHTVQVIELVEGPPPPPRRITSVINDSSVAASSSCDDSSEASLSTEEPSCSSYCSSDIPSEHLESPQPHEQTRAESSTETYSVRMKRILAWRENFSSSIGATFSGR